MKDGKEAASAWQPAHSWRTGSMDGDAAKYGFWSIVALFSLAAILFQLGAHFTHYTDYIGPDPDDSMRLVEVRDFLAGQNWFDLTQYRLGPDGGTLMHWSRLIDLPIAALISFFSLFLSQQGAEAAAALVWPPLLLFPLMASTGLAAYRIGGRHAMLMALGLAVLFTCAIIRFRPGALDHHNVQLVLVVFIAAMLIDPLARASNFAAAALACGLALAIGVETTPLVAVTAATVSILWAIHGERYRRAAIGFGLAFAIGTGALFFGTTPARLYSMVTCDTLSVGFFALAAAGGLGLAAAAGALTGKGIFLRLVSLAAIGGGVLALTLAVAPQCLGNPLNDLDPLLKTMWLGSITEAQSIVAEMAVDPSTAGGFYAVGLIAIAVCAFRIRHGQQALAHAILLVLIAVSWAVTAYQIRGMIFANFLAFIPLSALIADLRDIYRARQNDMRAAAAFVFSALASIPSVWTFSGVVVVEAGSALAGTPSKPEDDSVDVCTSAESLKPLALLPVGRILATANPGAALLRFTPHSVLTANYHRNQTGMVEALKAGMASPADAVGMLHRDKVDYVLVCDGDPQVEMLKAKSPEGLFSRLANGEIPEFLEPVEGIDKRMKLFRVL
ncbi:MAG: hypothetical protein JWM58_920 [Rhizobium sp.]|nr:hypothetical protein [Rhizobium sp.]